MPQLEHHGILGQRWGRRNGPPYPLDGADHSAAEKKAGWRASLKENRRKKKIAKKRSQSLKKARAAKEKKAEFEAQKKKALQSGSAEDVLKYRGKLTNDELKTAVARINMEKNLQEIAASTKKSGWKTVDGFMKKVGKIGDWANTAANTYTNLKKLGVILDGEDPAERSRNEKTKKLRAKAAQEEARTRAVKAKAERRQAIANKEAEKRSEAATKPDQKSPVKSTAGKSISERIDILTKEQRGKQSSNETSSEREVRDAYEKRYAELGKALMETYKFLDED